MKIHPVPESATAQLAELRKQLDGDYWHQAQLMSLLENLEVALSDPGEWYSSPGCVNPWHSVLATLRNMSDTARMSPGFTLVNPERRKEREGFFETIDTARRAAQRYPGWVIEVAS